MPLQLQLQSSKTKDICIVPHDFELSQVNEDCELLIIDYAYSYIRNANELELCKKYKEMGLTVPWVLITSNFEYYHSDVPEIVYYPVHLIQCLIENKDSVIDILSKRNFNVGFMNGNLYNIRIMLALEMFKYGWFSTCKLNFPDVTALNENQEAVYRETVNFMDANEKALMSEFIKLLPLKADEFEEVGFDGLTPAYYLNNNAGFVDCYVNAMVESEWNLPFITEKSIKPFVSGQFGAVLTNVGVYSHLQELGFDMSGTYIPFTKQGDMRESLAGLCQWIDELLVNVETTWDETYTRRLANYEWAKSDELINKLQGRLFKIIS